MDDFLLDNDNDVIIKNGDFVIGDATLQHQNHILLAQKGEFKNGKFKRECKKLESFN